MCLSTPAWALDHDPVLGQLCTVVNPSSPSPCGEAPRPDQKAFAALTREYGMALGPRLMQPAETLGVNGFAFALQLGLTNVDENKSHWQKAIRANEGMPTSPEAPSTLQTLQLDLRKGLPFSIELGADLAWLMNSELLSFSGSVKVALHEAVRQFPLDGAVRASVGRMVGSSELEMTFFGLDVVISHGFGVGRSVNIAPYMAYSPLFIYASSGVVDSSPGDHDTPAGTFVFADEDQVIHRFVFGSRFIFGAFNFTPEAAIAQGIQSYNFNVGLDF
ncbi:MAG: hypothetical protein R3F60_07675 [bacterium]